MGSWLSAEGLVVPRGVEGEFAEEFAGRGVDDADMQAVDEFEDLGSGVLGAESDVVHSAVEAEADFAVAVDSVGQDAVVDVGAAIGGRAGFRAGVVGGGGSGSVWQG